MDWRFLTVREVVGMALILLLIVSVIWLAIRYPERAKAVNHGFGPEWSCTNVPNADYICLKNRPPVAQSAP